MKKISLLILIFFISCVAANKKVIYDGKISFMLPKKWGELRQANKMNIISKGHEQYFYEVYNKKKDIQLISINVFENYNYDSDDIDYIIQQRTDLINSSTKYKNLKQGTIGKKYKFDYLMYYEYDEYANKDLLKFISSYEDKNVSLYIDGFSIDSLSKKTLKDITYLINSIEIKTD